MLHFANFKYDRFTTVPCTIIKKSLYLQDYLISYADPKLGGVSQEWAESYRVVFNKKDK